MSDERMETEEIKQYQVPYQQPGTTYPYPGMQYPGAHYPAIPWTGSHYGYPGTWGHGKCSDGHHHPGWIGHHGWHHDHGHWGHHGWHHDHGHWGHWGHHHWPWWYHQPYWGTTPTQPGWKREDE